MFGLREEDGQDIEFVLGLFMAVPEIFWVDSGEGLLQATRTRLINIEQQIASNRGVVRRQLLNLRRRFDGCGATADDWIKECTVQIELRVLMDILADNLKLLGG